MGQRRPAVESLDDTRSFGAGRFAFQQRDPGSKVETRRIEVEELPDSAK